MIKYLTEKYPTGHIEWDEAGILNQYECQICFKTKLHDWYFKEFAPINCKATDCKLATRTCFTNNWGGWICYRCWKRQENNPSCTQFTDKTIIERVWSTLASLAKIVTSLCAFMVLMVRCMVSRSFPKLP